MTEKCDKHQQEIEDSLNRLELTIDSIKEGYPFEIPEVLRELVNKVVRSLDSPRLEAIEEWAERLAKDIVYEEEEE